MIFSATHRALPALLALILPGLLHAGEVELSALKKPKSDASKYGAYVGFFAGASTGQDASMKMDYTTHSLNYDLSDTEGSFLAGFDVGYSWRTKYYVEFGAEFEGFFGVTETNALIGDNGGVPISLSDVATTRADMNYAAFMFNGSMTLDLRRLRPRIGSFWPRFRPFVGAGFGGAQLFFRNQKTQTFGDLFGTATAPSASPFSIDEFVFAWQIFGGLEFTLSDKLAIYSEYRQLTFEKAGDLSNFEMELFTSGLHVRF